MKRMTLRRLTLLLFASGATSCTTLLRENVLATTNTSVGVNLSQNPETSLYELGVGYQRGEFFFVPTSKRIVYDKESGNNTNDPSSTPEVLAVIGASGNANGTQTSGSIGQALAVGKRAVESPVAIAVFARDARSAEASADALKQNAFAKRSVEDIGAFISVAASTLQGVQSLADANDARAEELVREINDRAGALVRPGITRAYSWDDAQHTLDTRLISGQGYANALELLDHLNQIRFSVDAIDSAIAYLEPTPSTPAGGAPAGGAPAGGAPAAASPTSIAVSGPGVIPSTTFNLVQCRAERSTYFEALASLAEQLDSMSSYRRAMTYFISRGAAGDKQ